MITEKLYYEDAYLSEFSAVVVSCEEEGGGYKIILDKTAFYPVGGGQPSDAGIINGIEVTSVIEKDKSVIHVVNKPIEKGTAVTCKVNIAQRFALMQEHSGEHIISGIIKKRHNLNNVGFHMGKDYVTIDIDGALTSEEIAAIEELANEAVYKNIPVVSHFHRPDELKGLEFRSKRDFDEDVRIVVIDGYDTCACCGTHVKTTGEIGIIKITNFHNYKKGVRIYMVCGKRGLNDYAEKNTSVYKISELLSSKPNEITKAVTRLMDENASLKQQLTEYKQKRIWEIAQKAPNCSEALCLFETGFSSDDLRRLCTALTEKAPIAAVFSENNGVKKYAVGSKSIDVRPIISQLNQRFSGKGGGSKNMASGFITASENDVTGFFSSLDISLA